MTFPPIMLWSIAISDCFKSLDCHFWDRVPTVILKKVANECAVATKSSFQSNTLEQLYTGNRRLLRTKPLRFQIETLYLSVIETELF